MLDIFKKIALVLVVISFSPGLMAAPFVIDDFTVATQQVIVASGSTSETGTATDMAILGGSRQMNLTTASSPVGFATFKSSSFGGQLALANDPGVTGTASIIWNNSGNGFDADITQGGLLDLLTMNVIFIDQDVTVQFTLTDTIAFGGDSHTTATQEFTGAGLFLIGLSEFSDDSVDTEHIASIEMILTGPDAWDGTFTFLQTDTSIPEPGSIVLLGLGLVGLGYGRRKS